MSGERSNYVELLEAEVRRLQAEVVRLTNRLDVQETVRATRDCVACGKRFEVGEPGGQDACSKRCVRAYVLGKRAKKGPSKA